MSFSPAALSYVALAAMLAGTVWMNLETTALAGLMAFTVLDVSKRRLSASMRPWAARFTALGLFIVVAVVASWLVARFMRQSLETIPGILGVALPKLVEVAERYGFDLPFENVDELRRVVLAALRDNVGAITVTSGLLTKGFFHIAVGIFVAIFAFMSLPRRSEGASLYDAMRNELAKRVGGFMACFEKVVGAQVVISSINTVFTGIFLMTMGFPHAAFLIPATFILGMLPIVGNILSNTIIVGTALTISLRHAAFAMAFLVVIHKGEYFLNSRIVGESIKTPMWETLLAILVGEVVMGIPGIIIGPAVMRYLKDELAAVPLGRPRDEIARASS